MGLAVMFLPELVAPDLSSWHLDHYIFIFKGTLHPFALSFVSLETQSYIFEWSWFIPLFPPEM